MATQKSKFFVGLFVASGVGIALVAIIWLGMSRFLEKGQFYATYFNESVQGLNEDDPVKYRGVAIGRVESIGVASDSRLIQIVLKIESGMELRTDMVAQLKSVGITGIMFVELDRKKKDEPDRSPPLSFPSEYPIVASKPSEISELLRGLDDVLNQIKSLDLVGISDKMKLALDNINQSIVDADVKGISKNIEGSIFLINKTIAEADVKGISDEIGLTLDKLNRTITEANLTGLSDDIKLALGNLNQAIVDADAKGISSDIKLTVDNLNKKIADADMKGISDDIKLALARLSRTIADANLTGLSDDIRITVANLNQGIADADVKGISDNLKFTMDNVNQTIAAADLKGLSDTLKFTMDNLNRIILTADRILDNQKWDKIMASVDEAGQSLNSLMHKADKSIGSVENTFARVEGIVTEKEKTIKTAIEEFRQAMENANLFLEKGSSLVSGTDDSIYHLKRYLLVTGQNLEKASENLNRLIDFLADQPSQLIFGQPPPPRKVEPEVLER